MLGDHLFALGATGECGVRWLVSSSGNATAGLRPDVLEARVPGDLLTDLQMGQRIADPLWLNKRHI